MLFTNSWQKINWKSLPPEIQKHVPTGHETKWMFRHLDNQVPQYAYKFSKYSARIIFIETDGTIIEGGLIPYF